jgi:hypothetical protein
LIFVSQAAQVKHPLRSGCVADVLLGEAIERGLLAHRVAWHRIVTVEVSRVQGLRELNWVCIHQGLAKYTGLLLFPHICSRVLVLAQVVNQIGVVHAGGCLLEIVEVSGCSDFLLYSLLPGQVVRVVTHFILINKLFNTRKFYFYFLCIFL